MNEIDCRGLSCPTPVIMAKKAVEASSENGFRIILDNGAATENVIRYCNSAGSSVSAVKTDEFTTLTVIPGRNRIAFEKPVQPALPPVILITSELLGSGADELGRLLMKNFIITLLELPIKPEKMLFLNSGILLTTEGSELLEPLSKLAECGVEILSCGVCLDYYGVREKLRAGSISNMLTIAESLLLSGNSIKI